MGLVINTASNYWLGNRVPFVINNTDFPAGTPNRQAVMNAITAWNATGAVQLTPRNGEADHVIFRQHPTACSTNVGRQGGAQDIRCAVGAGFGAGNVMHEIGHALGLFHEHQRSDRTGFVTVDPSVVNNINYRIPNNGLPVGAYDCGSIMHYGVIAGAITNNPGVCLNMGQRNQPSVDDIWAANVISGQAAVNLGSAAFTNVFLRMDGSGVTQPLGSGTGTVNCQFGIGPWEQFRLEPQANGTVAIASVAFPNVYLRMDGSGVIQPLGSGAGTVNCQFGIGPWEQFRLEPQANGTVAIASVAFPNVYLRMDGSGITQPLGSGAGTVNCQFGIGPWEQFRVS